MDLYYGQSGTNNPTIEALGVIACYIGKNISLHASLYKKDPYNQYIWIEITDINDKKNVHINLLFCLY